MLGSLDFWPQGKKLVYSSKPLLQKNGGLNFLLRYNYDTKYLKHLPIFHRNILEYFRDLKSLYGSNQAQDIILFNNIDILVGETPVYISECFKKGIVSIRDLLSDDGNFLTFQEFTDKYPCKTNFLQYYQIINAIPKDILLKAKSLDSFDKSSFVSNNTVFNLNDTLQIHLEKAKSRVFFISYSMTKLTQSIKQAPQNGVSTFRLTMILGQRFLNL